MSRIFARAAASVERRSIRARQFAARRSCRRGGRTCRESATWIHRSQGWTLSVDPTGWLRANCGGYVPGAAAWDELYSKYKNHGLDTNLGGMRDQLICHVQIACFKDRFNLDEWRPDVSYAATLAALCNPGGGND